MKKLLQWLSLILLWLTLSPIFFIFARKWKLMPRALRWILMLISPFFLIFYLLIFFVWVFYSPQLLTRDLAKRKTVSEITEVDFPKYKVVSRVYGNVSFNGDFTNTIYARFENEPNEEFYQAIERLCKQREIERLSKQKDNTDIEGYHTSLWSVHGDSYFYSSMWGNGIPAPPGQNSDEDMFISIYITKGEKDFKIEYGMW